MAYFAYRKYNRESMSSLGALDNSCVSLFKLLKDLD